MKRIGYIAVYLCLFCLLWFGWNDCCYGKETVVVIDPGHGGDNKGGEFEQYTEKYMDMEVAEYIVERLSEYDGVSVYLTHDDTETKDLTRKERATIANDADADFLISVHFNMSMNHNLYGTEIWTSAFSPYYYDGYRLGEIILEKNVEQLGLFNRGIKTRISDKTNKDYYGIIQNGVANGIPTIIIEHCHIDEERDREILKQADVLKNFGYNDADAIAEYFGLSSSKLGILNEVRKNTDIESTEDIIYPDTEKPHFVCAAIDTIDYDNNIAYIKLEATDNGSGLQYYAYCENRDDENVKLYPWNDDIDALYPTDNNQILVSIPLENTDKELYFAVYDKYDNRLTAEEVTVIPAIKTIDARENELNSDNEQNIVEITNSSDEKEDAKKNFNIVDAVIVCLLVIIAIASTVVLVYICRLDRIRKRKRKNVKRD
ncbi:MAG: N-acetylmuramoyl-L-alanine amidase [Lachnospiraceae bacterium]|nr:N-acetylmuramoyl-L-alanine amidase [Candidatus Colinaster equi]